MKLSKTRFNIIIGCMAVAFIGTLGACSQSSKKPTIDKIVAANTYDNIFKNHDRMNYNTTIYAYADVDEGYLGFQNLSAMRGAGMITSGSCQSELVTESIYKDEAGDWAYRYQAADTDESRKYDGEKSAMEALKEYELLSRKDVTEEKITDISVEDDAYVVVTEKRVQGEASARTVYYWLNMDNLELYAINETVPTDTDYGDVLYVTSVEYDVIPEFNSYFVDYLDYDEAIDGLLDSEIFDTDEYMDLANVLARIHDDEADAVSDYINYSTVYSDYIMNSSLSITDMVIGWTVMMQEEEPNVSEVMRDRFDMLYDKIHSDEGIDSEITVGLLDASIINGFNTVSGKEVITRVVPNVFCN